MRRIARLLCVAGFSILVLGCESNTDQLKGLNVESTLSSQSNWPQDSNERKWQKVSSNEWFELFELQLNNEESLFCIAFHKTDAQLGIGISVLIARTAINRGFGFFRAIDASPTKIQEESVEKLLPDGIVLLSYSRINYFDERPIDGTGQIIDANSMAKITLDSDKP